MSYLVAPFDTVLCHNRAVGRMPTFLNSCLPNFQCRGTAEIRVKIGNGRFRVRKRLPDICYLDIADMRSHKKAISCLLMWSTWPENHVCYASRPASAHQKKLKSAHLLHGNDYFLFLHVSRLYPYKPQEIARRLNQTTGGQDYTARRVSNILEQSFRRLSEDQEIRDLLQGD